MNLVIDLGNTVAKFYIYDKDEIIDNHTIPYPQELDLFSGILFSLMPGYNIENVIISSVTGFENSIAKDFKKVFKKVIVLDENTKIPVKNLYKTPKTLGYDRIAGVVGANFLFPDSNILVIDAGTAVTYDYINENAEYLGGNISPGLDMRFRALNTFTKKLPLFSKKETEKKIGDTTEEAIIIGVQNGLLFEIQGYIDNYQKIPKNNKIILTGGDCFFFDKRLKRIIFVLPNLISLGLNRILEYNV